MEESSNRTFMELKLDTGAVSELLVGSNRTFMELKYVLWQEEIEADRSSNRTFMELKLLTLIGYLLSLLVLIVPLWN